MRWQLMQSLIAVCSLAYPWNVAIATAPTSFYANFKDTRLIDQDGRRLHVERLVGRTVLVNFVFTGCATACAVQTRALAELQARLPGGVRARTHLLSISLDPLSDTPQALGAFARRMGSDLSGWTFATGRPEDIDRLSTALRLFGTRADAKRPQDHSTALWLIDAQGRLRMRYDGNPIDLQRLLREVSAIDRLDPKAGG